MALRRADLFRLAKETEHRILAIFIRRMYRCIDHQAMDRDKRNIKLTVWILAWTSVQEIRFLQDRLIPARTTVAIMVLWLSVKYNTR